MSHFQQSPYTVQLSPVGLMNSPQSMAPTYMQSPSMMQQYYPPMQPPQHFPQPVNSQGFCQDRCSDLTNLCLCLLCVGACSYCCTEGCCGDYRPGLDNDCCCCF